MPEKRKKLFPSISSLESVLPSGAAMHSVFLVAVNTFPTNPFFRAILSTCSTLSAVTSPVTTIMSALFNDKSGSLRLPFGRKPPPKGLTASISRISISLASCLCEKPSSRIMTCCPNFFNSSDPDLYLSAAIPRGHLSLSKRSFGSSPMSEADSPSAELTMNGLELLRP